MLNMTLPCMQMTENFQCCHLHTVVSIAVRHGARYSLCVSTNTVNIDYTTNSCRSSKGSIRSSTMFLIWIVCAMYDFIFLFFSRYFVGVCVCGTRERSWSRSMWMEAPNSRMPSEWIYTHTHHTIACLQPSSKSAEGKSYSHRNYCSEEETNSRWFNSFHIYYKFTILCELRDMRVASFRCDGNPYMGIGYGDGVMATTI